MINTKTEMERWDVLYALSKRYLSFVDRWAELEEQKVESIKKGNDVAAERDRIGALVFFNKISVIKNVAEELGISEIEMKATAFAIKNLKR